MTETDITELMRLTFILIFRLTSPLLAVALVMGLVVALLQAVTQINEATLVFIPKLLGIGVTLLLLGVSMFGALDDFLRRHHLYADFGRRAAVTCITCLVTRASGNEHQQQKHGAEPEVSAPRSTPVCIHPLGKCHVLCLLFTSA